MHIIQNYLRQGGAAPLQPPHSYLLINFDRKETENVHLWFKKTYSLMKRRAAPLSLRPPKIIYFCKLD